MKKSIYLAPSAELLHFAKGLQVLANLSLDAQIEDYEGAEIEFQ